MSFRQYLNTRYTVACNSQRGIQSDSEMITMLQSGKANPTLVQTWMREYGLFQGITNHDRCLVVEQFLAFAGRHRRITRDPTNAGIQKMYEELFRVLYASVPRSWASATSKLLWCMYPETVVIYDTFVHRALVVLQCIDDDLAGFERIGVAPKIQKGSDIAFVTEHYMNYQSMVRRLLFVHAPLLRALRRRHKEQYPYDIRILDKVLWMIGNPKEIYAAQAPYPPSRGRFATSGTELL